MESDFSKNCWPHLFPTASHSSARDWSTSSPESPLLWDLSSRLKDIRTAHLGQHNVQQNQGRAMLACQPQACSPSPAEITSYRLWSTPVPCHLRTCCLPPEVFSCLSAPRPFTQYCAARSTASIQLAVANRRDTITPRTVGVSNRAPGWLLARIPIFDAEAALPYLPFLPKSFNCWRKLLYLPTRLRDRGHGSARWRRRRRRGTCWRSLRTPASGDCDSAG